jgi:hypothetical protein
MGSKNLKATNHSHSVVTICITRYKLKTYLRGPYDSQNHRDHVIIAIISLSSTTRCTLNGDKNTLYNRDTTILYNGDTAVLSNRYRIVLYNGDIIVR